MIPEHGKAPQFFGAKQLLHGVSWSLLIVSLTMSTFSSQLLTLKLRSWNGKECYRSKIAATMLLSTFLFLGGFSYNLYICISATKVRNKQEMSYVWVFFGSILLVCFRRMCWCIYFQGLKGFCTLTLTEGHGEKTSKNIFSGVALYPAVFIACHHLLWILLGVITEPLWGVTVLITVITTCAMFFFSLSELYHIFSKNCSRDICCGKKHEERNQFCMSVFMILTILFAFVLFVVVLIVVTQVFQSESLILTLIQNIMTGVVTVWFGYVNIFKESNQGDEGEGGDKCNGNGAEGRGCKGKRKRKRSAIQGKKISQSRDENV